MANAVANIGGAADPRLDVTADMIGSVPDRILETLYDPRVQIEEYMYYAKISREEEKRLYGPDSDYAKNHVGFLRSRFPGGKSLGRLPGLNRPDTLNESVPEGTEHFNKETLQDPEKRRKSLTTADENGITEAEWLTASRAARTATWGTMFYLITTDILGPFSVPWAFTQLGWGPGAALYVVFAALAGYSGLQLWHMFLRLDSDRYPMKNYGDWGFRINGSWLRHIINFLQSFQFFLGVGLLIISNGGQAISQLSKGKLCYIVCSLIFTIAGFIVGQIRTLARFGWIANASVWMNLLIIFFTMGVVANSEPNYTAEYASYPGLFPNGPNNPPPISTTGGSPAGLTFIDNINGLMQAVYSYGGATMFAELMAEMRRPWDFWKGLILADTFIFVCYVFFGMFVYGYQGQYAFNPAYQGINPYGWQTACNVLSILSGLIAACLYGNIGIKVFYNNLGRELLNWPVLEAKKGKVLFAIIVPIYWALAFVVASAVPQFSLFSALVAAVCIIQFTYTFPPFLAVCFRCQEKAVLPEETFDPQTGTVNRVDRGVKRWARGFRHNLFLNVFDTIYFLGSAVTAVLGTYSAIYSMNANYKANPNVTAFTCRSPTG